MKFDRSNKFDLCYYGQVNSLRLKSSVASKWANKYLWGNTYFAGDGTYAPFRCVTLTYNCFHNLKTFFYNYCDAQHFFITFKPY